MNWISRLALIPLILVSIKAYREHDYLMMVAWTFLVVGNVLFYWIGYRFKKT